MADDALFTESAPEPIPTPEPTAESTTEAEALGSSRIVDQVGELVKSQLAPVGEAFRQISQRLDQVENQTRREEVQPDPSDIQREAWTDPDSYYEKKFNESAQTKLGPLFQTMLEDKYSTMRSQAEAKFNNEFGEGKFSEYIAEDLDAVVQAMPPQLRASQKHFNTAIEGLMGRKFNALAQAREEAVKTKSQARSMPTMLGGGAQTRPRGNTISDDERNFLAEYARHTGEQIDPKAWVADRERGNTEDDWPGPEAA